MGSIGAMEILVILVVALLVLGPDRLPDAARQMGRAIAEMRKLSSGFQAELRDAMHTVSASPPGPSAEPPAAPTTSLQDGSASPGGGSKFVWNDLPTSPEPGETPS